MPGYGPGVLVGGGGHQHQIVVGLALGLLDEARAVLLGEPVDHLRGWKFCCCMAWSSRVAELASEYSVTYWTFFRCICSTYGA